MTVHSHRHLGSVTGAALVLGLTLAGCSAPADTRPDASMPTGPVTITWQAAPFGNRADDARIWLVEEFERLYPNIDVEVISAPTNVDTNRASLSTQILGGATTPDIYNGDVAWAAQLASGGLALPLSDYLPEAFWSAFDAAMVEGASLDGTVYGVPLTLDQPFLYYRTDLLEKHGLPVPTTWEEVAAQSAQLIEAGEVETGLAWQGASYEGLTAVANEFIAAAGGAIVSDDASSAAISDEDAVRAVEFMRGLITDGVSTAGVSTYQEPQALQTFTNGQAAFLRNWAYAYRTADAPETSSVAGNVGVTAMPSFEGEDVHAATIGGWNVYVNPHTEELGASLAFVEWLTSNETQTELARRSSTIPSISAVRNSPEVQALSPVIVASAGNTLVSRPTASPYYPQISQAVFGHINGALTGSDEVRQALEAAAAAIDAALAGRSL